MNKGLKKLLFAFLILTGLTLIIGCTHTAQGMKQDIREDTNSDYDTDKPKQVTVIKQTEVVYPSRSVPTSPPPLQTPPQ